MARPKKTNKRIPIKARIPDYLYNIIVKNKEDKNYNTITESLINLLCDGINYRLIMEDESKDNWYTLSYNILLARAKKQ